MAYAISALRAILCLLIICAVSSCAGGGGALGTTQSLPAPVPTNTVGPVEDAQTSVYVADGSGPLAAYAATSVGPVTPVLTIANPNLANTAWNPWGVTFDKSGNLYVQSFLSFSTTFVFPPGAHGLTLPSRIFMGSAPDNRSIAVDSAGYEYIAASRGASEILVMDPSANGTPNNLYFVPPLRSFLADQAGWSPDPSLLAVDSHDDILAAIVRDQANAINVFAGGATGNGNVLRTISGPQTRLGGCARTCGTACDLAITYSRYTGNIYVGVSAGTLTHISVFPEDARGNAAPIQTIGGPDTGLSKNIITGIAVSQRTGDIYAMVKGAQFGMPGRVMVFGRNANGNVAPERSFVDAHTGFIDANGIAIAP